MQVEQAQINSARLVRYFTQMGIDPELFTASALTSSNTIALPSEELLRKWRVTTDQKPIVVWAIDESNGVTYLRGQRREGGRKETLAIGCKDGNLFLYGYFDGGALGPKLASDALILDAERYRISNQRTGQEWESGLLVVTYVLNRDFWHRLRLARNIGVTVHSPTAPSGFAGIEKLPFETGLVQRDQFARRCMQDLAP